MNCLKLFEIVWTNVENCFKTFWNFQEIVWNGWKLFQKLLKIVLKRFGFVRKLFGNVWNCFTKWCRASVPVHWNDVRATHVRGNDMWATPFRLTTHTCKGVSFAQDFQNKSELLQRTRRICQRISKYFKNFKRISKQFPKQTFPWLKSRFPWLKSHFRDLTFFQKKLTKSWKKLENSLNKLEYYWNIPEISWNLFGRKTSDIIWFLYGDQNCCDDSFSAIRAAIWKCCDSWEHFFEICWIIWIICKQ